MMAELVKYVSQLEKKLINLGESKTSIEKIKTGFENEYKVEKIRNNPKHQGQELVYFYEALRKEYVNLLETKYNLDKNEIRGN